MAAGPKGDEGLTEIGLSNKNTAITCWQFTGAAEYAPARWQLNRHNDYSHLLDQ